MAHSGLKDFRSLRVERGGDVIEAKEPGGLEVGVERFGVVEQLQDMRVPGEAVAVLDRPPADDVPMRDVLHHADQMCQRELLRRAS